MGEHHLKTFELSFLYSALYNKMFEKRVHCRVNNFDGNLICS